jgi:hypothetical protein
MNKKGFLLAEETLKIILAVIAIGFLVYFLFSLYFSNARSEKLSQAEAILKSSPESMKVVIEKVRTTGVSESKIVPNPTGWYVFGFVSGIKPNSCTGQSCLCICEKVSQVSFYSITQSRAERQVNQCSDGVCLIVEDLKSSLEKEIESSTVTLEISSNGGIEIR